jgi:hypothetical protein
MILFIIQFHLLHKLDDPMDKSNRNDIAKKILIHFIESNREEASQIEQTFEQLNPF